MYKRHDLYVVYTCVVLSWFVEICDTVGASANRRQSTPTDVLFAYKAHRTYAGGYQFSDPTFHNEHAGKVLLRVQLLASRVE